MVPAAWVREATTNQLGALETSNGLADGYGYMWWTTTVHDDPAYLAYGFGGQMVEVIPERGLVVIVSSEVPDENAPALGADQLRYLAESVVAPLFER